MPSGNSFSFLILSLFPLALFLSILLFDEIALFGLYVSFRITPDTEGDLIACLSCSLSYISPKFIWLWPEGEGDSVYTNNYRCRISNSLVVSCFVLIFLACLGKITWVDDRKLGSFVLLSIDSTCKLCLGMPSAAMFNSRASYYWTWLESSDWCMLVNLYFLSTCFMRWSCSQCIPFSG